MLDEDLIEASPGRLTGKLLSLKNELLEDGFCANMVEDAVNTLLPVYNRWLHPVYAENAKRRLRSNQGLDGTELSSNMHAVKSALKTMDDDSTAVRKLSHVFKNEKAYEEKSNSAIRLKEIIGDTLHTVWFTRINLFSYLQVLKRSCLGLETLQFDGGSEVDVRDSVYWFDHQSDGDVRVLDKREKLIGYLLFHFNLRNYRKVESDPDYVYTQRTISTTPGFTYNTFTWQRYCTVRTAIYDLCRKEEQNDLWTSVISDKEVSNAETYLRHCVDHEFPQVQFQRRKYSFRDGVYDGDRDIFVRYNDNVLSTFPELDTYGTFMFIDQEFQPTYDVQPGSIVCSAFESIMVMQKWSPACIDMMYIMIGRLMHSVGEKDNWQILPYLIGEAGTGKSTIVDTIQKLVPRPLIGVFGSGGEAQFGTQDWDKLALIVFPEVKPNEFKKSMPLGKWFSLIAGDAVCLAAKFKAPRYVAKFPTHMIAAGNEAPSWDDCNGAFTRRTACFPFRVKLQQRNPDLPKLIDAELPRILRKALLSYYAAVQRFAGRDLWSIGPDGQDIMPAEIRAESRRMQKATTPMVDFLEDREYVELDPESEVSREDFIKVFDAFMRNVRHSYPLRWSDDLTSHAFQMFKLTVQNTKDGDIIRGVRMKKSCV